MQKQADVLPLKNQALHKLNYCKYSIVAMSIYSYALVINNTVLFKSKFLLQSSNLLFLKSLYVTLNITMCDSKTNSNKMECLN